MPRLFGLIDADKNGWATKDETEAYFAQANKTSLSAAQGGVDEIFLRADRDGDGKVTREELPRADIFKQLDANGDGAISLEETRARLGALMKKAREAAGAPTDAKPAEKPSPPLAPPAQGPVVLKGAEAGIGRQVADLGIDGAAGKNGLCIAFTSITCPVSKRYLPALAALGKELAAKDISLVLVNPMASESKAEFEAAARESGIACRVIADTEQRIARALDAATTTEVFLIDSSRTLIYRGAIDDQYGISYNRDAPRHNYLRDAVTAMLSHNRPLVSATTAPGCELDLKRAATTAADTAAGGLTYHRDIARIMQQNCIECHREGGLAPFALDDPAELSERAKTIKRVIANGTMPPWFAAPPEAGQPSPWINDRSLSAKEKSDLLAWLDGEQGLGDAREAPVPRQFPKDWQIGEPDAVFQLPKPIHIKAEGVIPYQNVVVDTALAEEKWVQAMEIQPTDREVVHHVLVFVQEADKNGGLIERVRRAANGRRIADENDETRGYFGIYVPGNSVVQYPEGFARRLPAGSRLRFQIHYTPKGKATEDRLRIGFKYAAKPPEHIVQVAAISNPRLVIPPHADNHPQTAVLTVPRNVRLLAFGPHMHVRGKAFRYDVVLPGGERRTLLDVPRYDFNWQLPYRYAEPLDIPAGSRIEVTGWYDNSAKNPANPDPSKTVRWGPQTFDEMLLGYVEYYVPGQKAVAGK